MGSSPSRNQRRQAKKQALNRSQPSVAGLLGKIAALEAQLQNLTTAFNHNVGVYANVFAGVEAVQSILQDVTNILARGEKPQMAVPEGGTEQCIDFTFYLKRYEEKVKVKKAEEEAKKAAESNGDKPAEAPEGVSVFGGD